MAMKMSRYPIPKGTPDKNGTTQWMVGEAVHPIQKSEITYRGPPIQASGRRRYSSIFAQLAWRALARARKPSYQMKMKHAKIAPTPTVVLFGKVQLDVRGLERFEGKGEDGLTW